MVRNNNSRHKAPTQIDVTHLTKLKRCSITLLLAAVIALSVLSLNPIPSSADNAAGSIAAGSLPYAIAVNPITNKIYVANQNSNNVTVIDGASNATATVAVGTAPCSVAVNPVSNKIYVTNFISNNVTVIDGASNAPTTVAVGTAPCSVVVNPTTNKIYVANQSSNNVTVIDGASNATATVAVGTSPRAVAVNPTTNKIYVANQSSNNVTVIDGASNATATVAVGTSPCSVAANPATNKIYVANNGSGDVTVIDGASNIPIVVTAGVLPLTVAVNPATNKIYVASPGSNTVTVIDGATNTGTPVATGAFPIAITINSATNKIYVANYNSNNVTVINGATNAPITTVAAGIKPGAAAVNPATNKIYIPNRDSNNVTVLDGADNTAIPAAVGTSPRAVTVNPVTNKIYVANLISNNVTVIDGALNSTSTIAAGSWPCAVAVNPATNKIYVANQSSNNVTVIDGASTATATVAAGTNPRAVAVNPATNKIYVANYVSNDVTVIDGASSSTSMVAAGTNPRAVAVNPTTNKIYVANYGSSNVTVIDGASNTTSSVAAGSSPYAVAVNPATNKIYIANYGSNDVTVIDGASNSTSTVAMGTRPLAVAVNSVTNKIYVANNGGRDVTVIDGASNSTSTVVAGSNPYAVAVNSATNKIYIANFNNSNVTVVDGASNTTATVAADSSPNAVAVNPATNKIYVVNFGSENVTVIEEQSVQSIDPEVTISALPGNTTANRTPQFDFSAAASVHIPVQQIWYQLDTITGQWQQALPAGGNACVTLPQLDYGTHLLYAVATNGQDATSINSGSGSSPLIGKIAAYAFTVLGRIDNDILTFTLPEQTGAATINNVAHTVNIQVVSGTNRAALAPTIALSPGASINPASGAAQNFSAPFTYTVTAENGTPQTWTVTVTVAPSSANDITSFSLPQQTAAAAINNVAHTINIEVANGTDPSSLTPTIAVSAGASINPASGAAQNFSAPFTYTVTAENGTPQTWTVTLTVALSSANDIVSFSLPEQTAAAAINNMNHTISIEVANGTDPTNLTPTITVSPWAAINPASGVTQNFSAPFTYTVTAENATPQTWTVTITVASSSANDILNFTLPEQTGPAAISNLAHTVLIEVANGTSLAGLAPNITISSGATVIVAGGGLPDFSAPVTYTVTAENGTPQVWTVTVTVASSSSNDILNFTLPEQTGAAAIDSVNHTVSIEVGNGTNLTVLTPTISISAGAALDFPIGTARDFSGPVTYTVTAENGTPQTWTVNVHAALSSSHDILTFTLPQQTGAASIDNSAHTVRIEVLAGTILSALTPSIALSPGAGINPANGVTQNFSAPFTYTVTAENGTPQTWMVTVTSAAVVPPAASEGSDRYSPPAGTLIGTSGGKISGTDIAITIPAGALAADTRFIIKQVQENNNFNIPSDARLISQIFDVVKNQSSDFNNAVTITIAFDKDQINLDNFNLKICFYDEAAMAWVPLQNISVDKTKYIVSGEITHFTKFALLAFPRADLKTEQTEEKALTMDDKAYFTDITGHWAEASIKQMASTGVINGYANGCFKPNNNITRAEFVTLLVKALNITSQGDLVFNDTKKHWARKNIAAAVAAGIVNGREKNLFNPDDLITREEIALMVVRATQMDKPALIAFKDKDRISPWARGAVDSLVAQGILAGYPDGSFDPQGKATRAEAVNVVLKAMKQK